MGSNAELVMRGHFLYWNMLGSLRGMETHQEDGLFWLSGDIFFNYHTEFSEPVSEKQADRIIARMKAKELPDNLMFMSNDGHTAAFREYVMATGLFDDGFSTTGMAHDLTDDNTILPKPDKRLNIFRVREISQLKAAGAILNTVFDYRLFTFGHFADMMRTDGVFLYLAEFDGLPAGACMSQHGKDFVSISWVGTLPGYRKLGIGGYLINAAERDGILKGKTVAVLGAFESAEGTYRRVGYRNCSQSAQIVLKANAK